jgi:transketolase N-terminal domain/subunit
VSTGSLGLGIGFAVGRAIGLARNKSARGTIAVVSDGELQEGITYEAMRLAGRERPPGLTVIVDANGWQTSGPLNPPQVAAEMGALAQLAPIYIDGHDVGAIRQAIRTAQEGPKYIVASTKTCKGLPRYEGGSEIYGESIDEAVAQELIQGRLD